MSLEKPPDLRRHRLAAGAVLLLASVGLARYLLGMWYLPRWLPDTVDIARDFWDRLLTSSWPIDRFFLETLITTSETLGYVLLTPLLILLALWKLVYPDRRPACRLFWLLSLLDGLYPLLHLVGHWLCQGVDDWAVWLIYRSHFLAQSILSYWMLRQLPRRPPIERAGE